MTRTTSQTIAYWTHGFCGVFDLALLLLSQGAGQVLVMALMYPYMALALTAFLTGFSSIPTAILSLLLIGALLETPGGIWIEIYVLACFVIVGHRIHLALEKKRKNSMQ